MPARGLRGLFVLMRTPLGIGLALLSALGGCSLTNAFEIPPIVGEWQQDIVVSNDSGSQAGRARMTFEEDGTGRFILVFSLTNDPNDGLYQADYAITWSTVDDELHQLTLTCLSITAPIECPQEPMPCLLAESGDFLSCSYSALPEPMGFEKVSDE